MHGLEALRITQKVMQLIAEPKGEASNRGARVAVSLYVYIYHHCRHTVQVTILRPTTTAITSTTTAPVTMHAFSICATALGKKQTTSASYYGLGPAPAPFRPPHVPRSTCTRWWKIRTTSASYRGSKTTLPPLACTMQQALVTCIRACH